MDVRSGIFAHLGAIGIKPGLLHVERDENNTQTGRYWVTSGTGLWILATEKNASNNTTLTGTLHPWGEIHGVSLGVSGILADQAGPYEVTLTIAEPALQAKARTTNPGGAGVRIAERNELAAFCIEVIERTT